MPHVLVQMYPGRSEEQKKGLASAIEQAVCEHCKVDPSTVSIVIEEIEKERWMQDIYGPTIAGKKDKLYKKPGYGPLADGTDR